MPASCRICRTWRSSTVLELVGLRLNVRPSEAAPLPPGLGPWGPWRACSAARSRRHWSLSVSIARRQRSTIAAIDCNTCSTKTPHRITCFREKKLTIIAMMFCLCSAIRSYELPKTTALKSLETNLYLLIDAAAAEASAFDLTLQSGMRVQVLTAKRYRQKAKVFVV